jgi:hypothetical protein
MQRFSNSGRPIVGTTTETAGVPAASKAESGSRVESGVASAKLAVTVSMSHRDRQEWPSLQQKLFHAVTFEQAETETLVQTRVEAAQTS